jgi:trimethylamine monooxygenase
MRFIGNYMKDMIQMCNYPNYKIDEAIELYLLLEKHKEENILTFRENIYKSTVTGTWSILK